MSFLNDMEEIDWQNYEPETILEIAFNRGNGEFSLPYIFQGVDKVGKPNLRYYDLSTGKIGKRLGLNLTSITGARLLKEQIR